MRRVIEEEPGVIAAYLFGSLVKNMAGPLSDIDVALLIPTTSETDATVARVTDALCRSLRTDRVDVVSLGHAAIPLQYRVVREGVLIASRDAAALQRFVAQAVLHYLDFKPLRDRAFAVQRQAILANS